MPARVLAYPQRTTAAPLVPVDDCEGLFQAEQAPEAPRLAVFVSFMLGQRAPQACPGRRPRGRRAAVPDRWPRRAHRQTSARPAGAVLGFLLAAVAMYTAFALLIEDSRGREVLPIGRLGAAREATHGTLAVELSGIERQPGVRRTL